MLTIINAFSAYLETGIYIRWESKKKMKRVEIQKDCRTCMNCTSMAELCDVEPFSLCHKCKKDTGLWIDTVDGFWGTYAIVQLEDGRIKKTSLDRLKVID